MKTYQYHYKRKNIKLRRVILVLLIATGIYYFTKNFSKIFPFFSIEKERLDAIKKILKEVDIEKDRLKKKVLLQKSLKRLNKIIEDKEIPKVEALILLGKAYLRKALLEYNKEVKDMYLDKAIYFFRKANALSPSQNGEIYYELGKSYFFKGEYYYYESLMELQKAKSLGYKSKNMEKLISFIKFQKGNINELTQLLQNFKDNSEDSIEKYFYQSYKLKDEGEYDKAIEYLHRVEEDFKNRSLETDEQRYILYKTYYALGWLYYNAGKYQESESYYNKAMEINSQSYEVYYWLGKLYYAMNKFDKAKKMWQKCLKLNPDYKPALDKLKQVKRR